MKGEGREGNRFSVREKLRSGEGKKKREEKRRRDFSLKLGSEKKRVKKGKERKMVETG